jgi:hypothetical protein
MTTQQPAIVQAKILIKAIAGFLFSILTDNCKMSFSHQETMPSTINDEDEFIISPVLQMLDNLNFLNLNLKLQSQIS